MMPNTGDGAGEWEGNYNLLGGIPVRQLADGPALRYIFCEGCRFDP
jgi:hypothetical protein